MKLGLIKGRHPLPVEEYLLNGEVKSYTKDKLQAMIQTRLQIIGLVRQNIAYEYSDIAIKTKKGVKLLSPTVWAEEEAPVVDLYITGLTIVSLVAVEELNKRGYNVNVWSYNPQDQNYYMAGLFERPEVW